MPEPSQLDSPAMTTHRRPPAAHDSALATRVFVVEEDVRELKLQITSGFASLHAKFDERSKLPWPALTLLLAFTIAIGGLAYWPIRTQTDELKFAQREYAQEAVARLRELREELILRDQRIWDQLLATRYKVEQLEALRGRHRDQ